MSTEESATLPGDRLRVARESAGLTQEDIAAKLKLSTRQISAIETGDWNALPERTFTRGFMRSYARLVSLDPDSLGLDQSPSQPHAATELKPTPEAIGEIAHEAQRRSATLARWLVPAALVAVLAAGASYVQWGHLIGPAASKVGTGISNVAGSAPVVLPANSVSRLDSPAAATSSGAVIAPASPPPAAVLPLAGDNSPATSPPLAAATTTAAAQPDVSPPKPALLPPPLAAGEKRITLTFKGKSWTEVRSKGDVIFSETAQPGAREFTGAPPLSFTVGNASNVALTIDGKPYDMSQLTRNDVARFRIE